MPKQTNPLIMPSVNTKQKFYEQGKSFVPEPVNNEIKYAPSLSDNILPIGTIIMWGKGTSPTGFEYCFGQAISRTTYAKLFAVIGTTFGVGNGTTTFNLPDFQGRFPLGAGTGGAGTYGKSLAEKGGDVYTDTGYANVFDSGHTHTITNGVILDGYTTGTGASAGVSLDATSSGTTDTDYAAPYDSGHTHGFTPACLGIYFLIKYQ